MNKYILLFATTLSIILICGMTTYKVVKIHENRLLVVKSKYIIEQAKKCVIDEKCSSDKIILKELYDKGYLDKQVNPVTKEYYKDESFVEKKEDNYEFISLN